MDPTISSMTTLKSFADMVRMSDGKFKTSIEKTTGKIFVDSDGNVHNVNRKTQSIGDASYNLMLRQQLVTAFGNTHASAEFMRNLRDTLGLTENNLWKEKKAGEPLDRKQIKQLLKEFNNGEAKFRIDGQDRVCPSFDFETAKVTAGDAKGWEVVESHNVHVLKARESLDRLRGKTNITPGHLARLYSQIEHAGPQDLQRLIDGFETGNIDPLPFGDGPRSLDLTKVQTEGFRNVIRESLNEEPVTDARILPMIKGDVNREWEITVGGKKLPTQTETTHQTEDIADILDKFFTEEEKQNGMKNKIMSMCNQNIYTPLSVMLMHDGSIPGSVMESTKRGQHDQNEKKIDVTRSPEGNVRVTLRVKISKFNLATSNSNSVVGGHYLDDRDNNYRETTVSYDVVTDKNGNPDIRFVSSPHVSYRYGRELEPDEVRTRIIGKIDDLLQNGREKIVDMVRSHIANQIEEITRNLNSEQKLLDYNKGDPTMEKDCQKGIARKQDEIKKLKDFNADAFKDFLDDPNTRGKLLADCVRTSGMPLSSDAFGEWNEQNVATALYRLFTGEN